MKKKQEFIEIDVFIFLKYIIRKMLKRSGILLFCLLIINVSLFAPPGITMRVSGKWMIRLRSTDLIGGAGSDFGGFLESTVDEVTVKISKASSTWRMDISRVDTLWPAGPVLYARITSTGTGDGTFSSNSGYQEITAADAYFFDGSLDRSGIAIQMKLDNFNLANLEVNNYSTTIYYTLTEP